MQTSKKVKKAQIKRKEDIEYIFKMINDNPGIYIKKLIDLSGRCSFIIDRCVKNLVESGRITKTKWFGHGIPYRIRLNVRNK